jgi:antitoxin CptB
MTLATADQLRRQCLRGMLELDLLLEAFLDKHYEALSNPQKSAFIRLLETPDPQLNAWILGQEAPQQTEFVEILELLRTTMS